MPGVRAGSRDCEPGGPSGSAEVATSVERFAGLSVREYVDTSVWLSGSAWVAGTVASGAVAPGEPASWARTARRAAATPDGSVARGPGLAAWAARLVADSTLDAPSTAWGSAVEDCPPSAAAGPLSVSGVAAARPGPSPTTLAIDPADDDPADDDPADDESPSVDSPAWRLGSFGSSTVDWTVCGFPVAASAVRPAEDPSGCSSARACGALEAVASLPCQLTAEDGSSAAVGCGASCSAVDGSAERSAPCADDPGDPGPASGVSGEVVYSG